MNHDELKHDITSRIDRLETDIKAQLLEIEHKLDSMTPSVIESRTRIEGMSGQIKLLWTILIAIGSGLIKLLSDSFK